MVDTTRREVEMDFGIMVIELLLMRVGGVSFDGEMGFGVGLLGVEGLKLYALTGGRTS